MSAIKPAIPVTNNLKERIAALEQKNVEAGQRSTSPIPGSLGPPPTGSALRDRIAKFEKKGAVPAPRGRFGLGVPPPPDAQIRKTNELYGNRIPQGRTASESTPPSRSVSSAGFYNGSPDFDGIDQRRSFSLRSIFSEADDGPDYTPLTSPTFAYPLNSPELVAAPESRALSPNPDGPSFKEPIKRTAPFSQVLEAARKAAEKGGGAEHINDAKTPTPFTQLSKEDVDETPPAQEQSLPNEDVVISSTPPESPAVAALPETAPVTIVEAAPTPPAIVVSPTLSSPDLPSPQPSVVEELISTPTSRDLPLPEEEAPLPAPTPPPIPVESEKSKIRNNRDLTVTVEHTDATPSPSGLEVPDDNTTPTTANPPFLLSPAPPSAISSVFSGSSFSSSDLSPRPYSMIDISFAERVTPATGRGNVMFLPPSTATMPRKSDLVYFPPTPTEEEKTKPAAEASTKPKVEEAPKTQPVTFTAVVHRKVRETPEPIPHPTSLIPQTPKNREAKTREEKRAKRMTTVIASPSPGHHELASLIQNAVTLETMVEKGQLPTERETEKAREEERRQREKERLAALAAERAKAAAEDAKRKAALEAAQKKEEEPPLSKLRHTFLIPLSRARTQQQQQHRKEASISDVETSSANGSLSHKSSGASMRDTPRLPRMLEMSETGIREVPPLPSKSPSIASSKSRFSTFRKFGSVKSVLSGRPSMDTFASEDSLDGSVTPPTNEFGQIPSANGSSWPNLSPKRPGNAGKATSFAEKMFSRSRTKSNGSTLSNASESGKPSKAYSMYTLPPLPDSLSVIPPTPEYEERNPRKSTSLRSFRGMKNIPPPMSIPPIPSKSVPLPRIEPPSPEAGSPTSNVSSPGYLKSPDYLGFGSMDLSLDDARPTSWMSVSSLTSELPSPLFEKDIFDAFPSVPASTPAIPTPANNYASYRSHSNGAPAMTPSFDSAFLSTAIHLAGSNQGSSTTSKSKKKTHPR